MRSASWLQSLPLPEDSETFELGPAEEAELRAAIADAERGDLVQGDEAISKLEAGEVG
jgi:predicted transcriptional regulator